MTAFDTPEQDEATLAWLRVVARQIIVRQVLAALPSDAVIRERTRLAAERYRRKIGKRFTGKNGRPLGESCVRGHDLTLPGARGHNRRCVLCVRIHGRKWYHKRKQR